MALFDIMDSDNAFIYARYEGGKFIDLDTNSPVQLKGKPVVKITVDRSALQTKEAMELHSTEVSKKVLDPGAELEFTLPGTGLYFTLVLIDALILTRKGNRAPVAGTCRIKIDSIDDSTLRPRKVERFQNWVVNSLNQAYFQVSLKYRTEARSHSINVYEHFHLKGDYTKTLDTLRKF